MNQSLLVVRYYFYTLLNNIQWSTTMTISTHQKLWFAFLFAICVDSAQFHVDYEGHELDCACLRWTKWINIGSPYKFHQQPYTYSSLLKLGRIIAQLDEINICVVPVSSDCQILVPYFYSETHKNIYYFACPYVLDDHVSSDGLVQIRFLCWDGNCPCLQWSKWFNNDRPFHGGDIEILHHTIIKELPCPKGSRPLDVECQTTKGKSPFETNDRLIYCDLDGLKCLNNLQGKNNICEDYKVRFLCLRQPDDNAVFKYNQFDDFGNNYSQVGYEQQPFARIRTFKSAKIEQKSKVECNRQLGYDLPISPNDIYGPCIVPLTCPRFNINKLRQKHARKKTHIKYQHGQMVAHQVDYKRLPDVKECDNRGCHNFSSNTKSEENALAELAHLSSHANATLLDYGQERRLSTYVDSQCMKFDTSNTPSVKRGVDNINEPEAFESQDHNQVGGNIKSPRYVPHIVPQYDPYHHNYPLMMFIRRRKQLGRLYGQRRQLPMRSRYQRHRVHKNKIDLTGD